MNEIHVVIRRNGGYEGWSFQPIAAFVDKAMADQLAANAQQVADALLEKFGDEAYSCRGLNPFDPHMALEPGKNLYDVVTQTVLTAMPVDPGAATADARLFFTSPGLKGLPEIATTEGVALAHQAREYVPIRNTLVMNPTEVEALPLVLASVQLGERVFDLMLEGEFVGRRWGENEGEYEGPSLRLNELTESEQQVLRDTGMAPAQMLWDSAFLSWNERGGDIFLGDVGLLATGETGLVAQLLRLLAARER